MTGEGNMLVFALMCACTHAGPVERAPNDVLGTPVPVNGSIDISCVYLENADFTDARYFFKISFQSDIEAVAWLDSVGFKSIEVPRAPDSVFSEATTAERSMREGCAWHPPARQSSTTVFRSDRLAKASSAVAVVEAGTVWGFADTSL